MINIEYEYNTEVKDNSKVFGLNNWVNDYNIYLNALHHRGMGLGNQKFNLGYFMFEVPSKIHVEIPISQLDMTVFISGEKLKL